MCVYAFVRIYAYVYVCIYMCVYVCVCVCVGVCGCTCCSQTTSMTYVLMSDDDSWAIGSTSSWWCPNWD